MPSQPWDRRDEESEAAYAAFVTYRDMGRDRTIDATSKIQTKSIQNIKDLSARHSWVDRSRAWDNHLQGERDKVAAAEARKWEKRRQQALEKNYDTVQKAREKLDKMIAWPLQRQETSKDGKTIIIEPVRWSWQTVVLLMRATAEIEAATFLAIASDPDELTDVEARATAEESGKGADDAGD